MNLKDYIKNIKDFPIEGIDFKDITPLLENSDAFKFAVDEMSLNIGTVDKIVGLDARGFLFAGALAYKLHKPLVLVRKTGKLPDKTITEKYSLEYGENSFDIHKGSINKGDNVAIIDDLLATGGTVEASISLIERLGGTVKNIHFVIELGFLEGSKKLKKHDIHSLIKY